MVSIAIFILGMISYKENLLPRRMIHEIRSHLITKDKSSLAIDYKTSANVQVTPQIRVLPYARGTPLFSDRNYEDSVGSDILNSSYVIQIPRHFDGNLTIKANKHIVIYRILSTQNNNQIFSDWNQTEIPVLVDGSSVKHSSVISKNFQPGDITLYSGGPVCSSPILVKRTEITKFAPPFSIK